jgi:hypothetical protein
MTDSATKRAREVTEDEPNQPSDAGFKSETAEELKVGATDQNLQILLGEDNYHMRKSLSKTLERDLNCKVQKPEAFKEWANDFFLQSPDGLIMDYKLDQPGWEPSPLNSAKIETGYDALKFCQKVNPLIPMCIYSRQFDDIPRDPSIFVIDKSRTHRADFKKEFRRFIKPVRNARKFFGTIQPKKTKETRESEMNKYRMFLKVFKFWLHYGFERLGNPYWVTLLDRKIEMCGTPPTTEEESLSGVGNISVKEGYPSIEELSRLSAGSVYKPLIYWNTRDDKVIAKQFKSAGPHLERIPPHLLEYFSVCMTPACVDLYFQDEEEIALHRAAAFSFSSQLEFARSVFKKLNSASKREKFKRQCQEVALPIIISVFSGRIDEIEEGGSGIETAWVQLKKFHSKDVIAEPFDYHFLNSSGVKSVNGLFEYAVYQRESHSVSFSITPDYDVWNDFDV